MFIWLAITIDIFVVTDPPNLIGYVIVTKIAPDSIFVKLVRNSTSQDPPVDVAFELEGLDNSSASSTHVFTNTIQQHLNYTFSNLLLGASYKVQVQLQSSSENNRRKFKNVIPAGQVDLGKHLHQNEIFLLFLMMT